MNDRHRRDSVLGIAPPLIERRHDELKPRGIATNADWAVYQIGLIRILWQSPIFTFLPKGELERTRADQRLEYSSASHRWVAHARPNHPGLACEEMWRVAVLTY
jgi:hypothetical protein